MTPIYLCTDLKENYAKQTDAKENWKRRTQTHNQDVHTDTHTHTHTHTQAAWFSTNRTTNTHIITLSQIIAFLLKWFHLFLTKIRKKQTSIQGEIAPKGILFSFVNEEKKTIRTGYCHAAVRFYLEILCLVISGFILKSNSPLVSGHLPFLMCHRSDCLSWFPIVSTCSPFPPCVK